MNRKPEFYIDLDSELVTKTKKNFCGQFKGHSSPNSNFTIIKDDDSYPTEKQVPQEKRMLARDELQTILSQNTFLPPKCSNAETNSHLIEDQLYVENFYSPLNYDKRLEEIKRILASITKF